MQSDVDTSLDLTILESLDSSIVCTTEDCGSHATWLLHMTCPSCTGSDTSFLCDLHRALLINALKVYSLVRHDTCGKVFDLDQSKPRWERL